MFELESSSCSCACLSFECVRTRSSRISEGLVRIERATLNASRPSSLMSYGRTSGGHFALIDGLSLITADREICRSEALRMICNNTHRKPILGANLESGDLLPARRFDLLRFDPLKGRLEVGNPQAYRSSTRRSARGVNVSNGDSFGFHPNSNGTTGNICAGLTNAPLPLLVFSGIFGHFSRDLKQ
jgi:hypothetical protein